MQLLLLRHGPAVRKSDWAGDDAERPLSEEGRLMVRDMAFSLARLPIHPDVVLTSPYLRARQTAEIVASCLGVADKLAPDTRLAPGFGPRQLARILRACGDCKTVMLVGHEPDLSDLVRGLTGGGRVAIRKAAVAQVDLTDLRELKGRLVALLVPTVSAASASSNYDGL